MQKTSLRARQKPNFFFLIQMKYCFNYCFICNGKDIIQFHHTILNSFITPGY